jgi:hypothetical protein
LRFQVRQLFAGAANQFDGVSFGPFAFKQDGQAAPKIDVSWGEVLQALMVAPIIVVIDEAIDLRLEPTW